MLLIRYHFLLLRLTQSFALYYSLGPGGAQHSPWLLLLVFLTPGAPPRSQTPGTQALSRRTSGFLNATPVLYQKESAHECCHLQHSAVEAGASMNCHVAARLHIQWRLGCARPCGLTACCEMQGL